MTDKKSPKTDHKVSEKIVGKDKHIAPKSKAEIEREKRPLNDDKTTPEKVKPEEGVIDDRGAVLEVTQVIPATEAVDETVIEDAIEEPPLEEDIEEQPEPATEPETKKPKRHSKAWLWWALGVILLILCGIGGFIWAQSLQEQSESTEQIEPEEPPVADAEDPRAEEEPQEEKPAEPEPEPEKPAPAEEPMQPIADRPQTNTSPVTTPGSRLIALTFDDGPSPATTPRLLDILKGRNVKATFFVLGNLAERNPDLVRREAAEGHEVASHTPYHDQLTRLSAAQVRAQALEMDRIFTNILGTVPPFTRPPYGSHNETVRTALAQPLIIWSIDPRDWADRNANIVCSRVTSAAFDGAIILTHDIHATTVDAVPCIIDNLRAQGYEFVTVSELAAAKDVPLVNGGVYGSF